MIIIPFFFLLHNMIITTTKSISTQTCPPLIYFKSNFFKLSTYETHFFSLAVDFTAANSILLMRLNKATTFIGDFNIVECLICQHHRRL